MNDVEEKKENFVRIGDANRLLGNIIPMNAGKVSFGGAMVREFLDSDKFVLLNSS